MKTIQERFEVFHQQNPHVYAMMLTIIRKLKARGVKRFNIETVWERMRWKRIMDTTREADDYKLNDHYRSRYARLLNEEPDLLGFFETRKLRAA